MNCPKCHSTNLVHQLPVAAASVKLLYLRCADCGNEYVVDAQTRQVVSERRHSKDGTADQ
jgi:hypothetical protein